MTKKNPKQNGDNSLFQQEMAGVKRLKQDRIEPTVNRKPPYTPKPEHSSEENSCRFIEMDYTPALSTSQTIHYHKSGLRDKILKQLKAGKLNIEASLDLHGRRVQQAGQRLQQFIDDSYRKGLRTVIVIHGKGYGSVNETAMLKQHINVWLRDYEKILAFSSAQARHGGSGALYVYLKRNPETDCQAIETDD